MTCEHKGPGAARAILILRVRAQMLLSIDL